jgi:signal transduction histidine kinase
MNPMRRFNLSSIRQRLTLSLTAGAIGLVLLISVAVWWVISEELSELLDHGLQESADLIHNVLANSPDPSNQPHSTRSDTEYTEHLIWQLVDQHTGTVVTRSRNAPDIPFTTSWHADVQHGVDSTWHLVTLEFRHDKQWLLVVAQSEEERHEALIETLEYTLLATFIVCVLGIFAMNWRMRVELRPLQQLSDAVRHYDPLVPSSSPAGTGRSELQPIEQAIQDLGQRLEQRIISEQAFTAHATHALRTPLAGIDAQLALAIREAPEALRPRLVRAREAASRLARVMQALLSMFRSGLEPQRTRLPLGQLLDSTLFAGLKLVFDPRATVEIDPDLLAPVLFNLLDNAQRHKAQTVELVVTELDGTTRLSILDDGEGYTADACARMREALARQDYSPQSGFKGLGLILADLVMRAHGGQLHLLQRTRGFGLELNWPTSEPVPKS